MTEFEDIMPGMKGLLDKLTESPGLRCKSWKKVPKEGIYVFYEDGKALYVGRAGKGTIRKRLGDHSNPSSKASQTPLAVRLVKDRIGKDAKGLSAKKIGETYPSEFMCQKARVREMEVRAVKITDCTTRAAFEIYSALALGTPYNDFCET